MSKPIHVDLPHSLGREEARRRIAANIHKLESHIPGGAAVTNRWEGDTLKLGIGAMGQSVDADIAVDEKVVRVTMALPGLLGSMFGGAIESALKKKGGDLLLEDKRD
jgi:putative polyhydroxyalkanoate system protein